MFWRLLGATLLAALLSVVNVSSPAYSVDDAVPHASDSLDRPLASPAKKRRAFIPQEPRTTTDGVLPLDEAISIRVKGVLLRVPAAYISPWPQAKRVRNRLNEWQALGFEFWMPGRRYLEISPLSNTAFRPLEPGRSEPNLNAYIVRVKQLQPINLDEPGYISPEQAYRNRTAQGTSPKAAYSFQDEPFGLVRFWPTNKPDSKFAVEYRHKEGSDPQILLDCVVPNCLRVFSECSGRVHFVDENLAFFVVFPRDEVSLAVRELYQTWKSSP